MGDIKGFLKVKREVSGYRPVCERLKDYQEVTVLRREESSRDQASRCMDCGTPFCHWGCPIGNYIPEWNDLMFRGQWKQAIELLNATNNFPEITGRLCPALCEYACVLGINDDPVTIREDELAIIEYAFRAGWINNKAPKKRTGRNIAIVGSGPAGLACADQLNKAGHKVTVFERDDKIGGILRYGIPDFKLEKQVIDRRLAILRQKGIKFIVNADVGNNIQFQELKKEFDAICLAGGCRTPRDLKIEGRGLKGIYFAMDYLSQANRIISGEAIPPEESINAKGKRVVVIGGGDTGADCIGTAHRQGADCVVQIEVLERPPESRTEDFPWPKYPPLLKTSTSHEEGGERHWAVLTKKFAGIDGHLKNIHCVKGESNIKIDADMVILAIGFIHPERGGLLDKSGVALDPKGNVKTNEAYMTSIKGVFSAGDMHRGQSLIVWAISEGRRAAYFIDKYLTGKSNLPSI